MGRHSKAARFSGSSAGHLAWRQFRADPWVSLGLAVLVGLVALLLTAVPRGLTDVQSRQLGQDVGQLSAQQRDVVGWWNRTVYPPLPSDPATDSAETWTPFLEGAEELHRAQPEPLRSVLGDPELIALVESTLSVRPPVETGYREVTYRLAVDLALTEHAELVEGDWPELSYGSDGAIVPFDGSDGSGDGTDGTEADGDGSGEGATDGVEVVLNKDAADRLHLEIGDTVVDNLVLSGTYEARDPDDGRWQHIDNAAELGVIPDADKGDAALATLFLSPENRGSAGLSSAVRMEVRYPVDVSAVTGSTDQVQLLRRQLTGFLAAQHVLVPREEIPDAQADQVPLFTSELMPTLDRVVEQQRTTSTLLAVIAAGPLGVALAVAALGARLVVHRRLPALALALARGAAPAQLRLLIAAEGLVLGVPAALAGHLTATALLPGPTPWWSWLVTCAVALVPAVALAASLQDASLLTERRDLSGRSRSRWRWVAEVAVLALAGIATWRLLDRDAGGGTAEPGIDLLVTATPILLALAACLLALRIYPLPLAALASALRRRPSLTPFLGAARALRDPAGGLVPALAMVLGTAVALISAVLLATVTRGAETAAWQENGAEIRLTGPVLTDQLRADLSEVEGVAGVAGIGESDRGVEVVAGDTRGTEPVWVVDDEVLALSGPGIAGLPEAIFATDHPAVVALGGVDLGGEQTPSGITVGPLGQVDVIDRLGILPGASNAGGLAVGRDAWTAAGGTTGATRITLLWVEDGHDPEAVADAVLDTTGSGVTTTVTARLDRFTQAPVSEGLNRLVIGATVTSGLLTVLAVIVVQLMGAPARARLLSVLRTLGLGPAQTRALTAWELAPLLAVSLLVGAALGLLVPVILRAGLDLRALTGGADQPALVLDPFLITAVLGAVILTVVTAITVSAWLAGRTNLAQALRVGEER